jgi:aconitate hydratase
VNDSFKTLRELTVDGRKVGLYHSLPALQAQGLGSLSRLPVSLRIMLESLLRNLDGERVAERHLRELAQWQPNAARTQEIPFVVSRIIAPDASGIPLLADLAAMREVASRHGVKAQDIEPLVDVDVIIDHSLIVDHAGVPDALGLNMREEFRRNEERYSFLKWAAQAFDAVSLVPPGVGIIHQVNIEKLTCGWRSKDGLVFPDTVVGPDSHTCMANGIGVLGWGVGGIEAESAMLGQPIYLLTPDVVGVELRGRLRPGVTATDLVLTVVETLRRHKVVGKFVEYFGEGAASLAATDRATVANMAPEYGPTAAFFPVDEQTLAYLKAVGRSDHELAVLRAYLEAQQMFGMPQAGDLDYSQVVVIDLDAVVPSVAGPRRPQDRVDLRALHTRWPQWLGQPASEGGFGRPPASQAAHSDARSVRDGDIVIAAITSCSNTSNPALMLSAGLLARKAVERGLRVPERVKTSLTPGSKVVAVYLADAGLQPFLDQLGFQVAGFGCATCMGNSGGLADWVDSAIARDQLVVASVLSGNRNFEGRIHQSIKANFLMSPPLVVAYALAGRIDIDMDSEPLGLDAAGQPVFLRELWPSAEELAAVLPLAQAPQRFASVYDRMAQGDALWTSLEAPQGDVFSWDERSSYLREPPFFADFTLTPPPPAAIQGARALALLGDSVTTDHISPGGEIAADSEAGRYLAAMGVATRDFNSYIARRAHDGVMARGTFASSRLKNLMLPGVEGGVTLHQPEGARMSIYEAAQAYKREGVPTIVLAGEEYGTGSSRDWAAKGPNLLGVRAVVARSFERIHRSNLVGMGILPCQFQGSDSIASLGLDGSEHFDIVGLEAGLQAQQQIEMHITRADGRRQSVMLLARVDTPIEAQYLAQGGILAFVLRKLMNEKKAAHV